jgi:glycine/D-amino acid oxidase-like deaminating enzyme
VKSEISTFSPSGRSFQGQKFNKSIPGNSSALAVIGAGILGVCSAYYLRKAGFNVTLFDKRGPGNSASSSGGESRLLRLIYGASQFYSRLTLDAIPLWMELQKGTDPFFIPSPVLWISGKKNKKIILDSLGFLESNKIRYRELSREDLQKKWPFMQVSDIEIAVLEELSGYLKARNACQAIASKFVEEGGNIIWDDVKPEKAGTEQLSGLKLSTGGVEDFDYFVIAAGPWLNQWVESPVIEVTRQEVHFFDVPANSASMKSFTSWVDLSYEPYFYGIPGDLTRGFKIACDKRGSLFNPDLDSRVPEIDLLQESRKFLRFRFPELAQLPLLESRVCQYSNSFDRNLIMDVHPSYNNVLLLGAGSGHGFKYGPAIGKLVSEFIPGQKPLFNEMRLF